MAPSPSSPSIPRRKFVVEPLETTVRSSRKSGQRETYDHEKPATTDGVKYSQANTSKPLQTPPLTPPLPPPQKLPGGEYDVAEQGQVPSTQPPKVSGSPQSVGQSDGSEQPERTTDQRRRHLPQPVETSRSSRKPLRESHEMGSRSNNKKPRPDNETKPSSSPRRFLPQPVETTTQHRRGAVRQKVEADSGSETARPRAGRKFKPELIETAKGSRTRQQPELSSRLAHEGAPWSSIVQPHLRPTLPPAPPANTPTAGIGAAPEIQESKFSAANLAKRQEKQHCYTVPGLPSIASDSSEASRESGSEQVSPTASAHGSLPGENNANRFDERFSAYMLSLAARAAEKQLRDQAMAAYPNETVHEPVDHFALSDDSRRPSIDTGMVSIDSILDVRKFRRESAADLELELEYMRRHHDEQDRIRKLKAADIGQSKFSAAAIAAKLEQPPHDRSQHIGGNQSGVGIKQMRKAASPPMLGDDLIFPQSLSPKATRCDPDQLPVPRTCEVDVTECEKSSGLWCANVKMQDPCESGLWMGMCKKSSHSDALFGSRGAARSGIMTPNPYLEDALAEGRHGGEGWRERQLPLTPLSSNGGSPTHTLDKKLWREKRVEDEFDDSFVTQIYNYLSLGFPSLARPFDHELSKISSISVGAIRKDDEAAEAQGYIGTPEGPNEAVSGVERVRWTALKLYIKEWFRQSSEMAENVPDDWGARVRRGSWAW